MYGAVVISRVVFLVKLALMIAMERGQASRPQHRPNDKWPKKPPPQDQRTPEIYPGKPPNGGKTQQPFLDRFRSQSKSN